MGNRTYPTRRQALQGVVLVGLTSLAGCTTVFGKRQPRDATDSLTEDPPSGSIHWHVTLVIEIDGEPRPIPPDVGIGPEYSASPYYDSGMRVASIHTHDDSGTIHWEVMEAPKEGELNLGAFFDIWGEPFSQTCVLDHCTDEGTLTMLVNGEPNDEFADYRVSDGDRIAIRND